MSKAENRKGDAILTAAMSIAGSDSGGAAGVQADLLTFTACGVYGTTAITALTAQNPTGVTGISGVAPKMVRAQIEQVLAYYPVRAWKTGMLFNAGIIEVVAQCLAANPKIPAVVDPVMVATSGAMLLEARARRAMMEKLLPKAALITPNFEEAAVLLGKRPARSTEGFEDAAVALAEKFGTPVLLKGGHFPGAQVVDVLAGPEGVRLRLSARRVKHVNTHGGGCTLAAAITAFLAKGRGLEDAVREGHAYLQRAFLKPLRLGRKQFLNHAVGTAAEA